MSNKVLATSRAARTSIEVDGSQSLPVGVVRTLKNLFPSQFGTKNLFSGPTYTDWIAKKSATPAISWTNSPSGC